MRRTPFFPLIATTVNRRSKLASILALERVALNFLTHLSGIATLTAAYADAVAGMPAVIYDTRKTHAGLRALEKYAVVCGGGRSHRMGLHDAVLVKDNHIAHLAPGDLPDAIRLGEARPLPTGTTLEEARRAFEREWLLGKLREHNFNVSRTAETVGLARESLSRKIRALKIEMQRG